MRERKGKRGVTLIEVMLAGAILTLLSLALFSGISVAARIAHENAELLSAEAVVWDAVWMKFNEDYSTIKSAIDNGWVEVTLSSNAAPALSIYGAEIANRPKLRICVEPGRDENGNVLETRCRISGDLEWGPAAKRRTLSDVCPISVDRGELGRVVTW